MKNLLVASTSTLYGGTYLSYLMEEISIHFKDTREIVFIPYARPGGISHDQYTAIATEAFSKIGKKIIGLHSFKNPEAALKSAKGVFVGGGNTFVLVKQLYTFRLMKTLREKILKGLPYLGTSAGSNICGLTMNTTNDMPIVYPPSFKTLGVLPFNINPHYLDPNSTSKHMGETRETRIKEFLMQQSVPVIGIREGSWLQVKNDQIILKGEYSARIFEHLKAPYEVVSDTVIKL